MRPHVSRSFASVHPRVGMLLCLCTLPSPPPPDVALVLIRPGDDTSLVAGLDIALADTTLSVVAAETAVDAGVDTILAIIRNSGARAVFELGICAQTFDVVGYCQTNNADFYSFQPAVSMFKRLAGSGGPAWLCVGDTSSFSEDKITEERGWGYLQGDEPQVVDTAQLSDLEIARLLDLEMPDTPGGDVLNPDDEQPRVSEYGYALHLGADPRSPPSPVTEAARAVLFKRATEPPGTATLADGQSFPPEGCKGVFASPLTGAPLFATSERRRSTTGWPSFSANGPSGGTDKYHQGIASCRYIQHLSQRLDVTAGAPRTEVVEKSSSVHLGHEFDGSLCINAASLVFVPQGEPVPPWLPQPAAPAIAALLPTRPGHFGTARVATLAAGCFWTFRAALEATPGVLIALAGFTGGALPEPTYEDVCAGGTGHVEAVQVAFDPAVISYAALLDVYWALVPDTASSFRQGADVGPMYEPAVFFHSDAQRAEAEASRSRHQARLPPERGRIVTRLRPAVEFWVAADAHQRATPTAV